CAAGGELVFPYKLSGIGFEREHAPACGKIHDSVNDDWRCFRIHRRHGASAASTSATSFTSSGLRGRGAAQPIRPGQFQVRYVAGVDLCQCRVPCSGKVVVIHRPIGCRIRLRSLCEQRHQGGCGQDHGMMNAHLNCSQIKEGCHHKDKNGHSISSCQTFVSLCLCGDIPAKRGSKFPKNRLRQSEHNQRLIIGAACSSRSGDYSDVLFSILPEICHGYRGDVVIQLHRPKLLSCFRFERAEASVVRCANEEQTSRGNDWTTGSRRSNILLTGRQRFIKPERYLPRNVAGIAINRDEPCPGWLAAGPVCDRPSILILHRRVKRGTIYARVWKFLREV